MRTGQKVRVRHFPKLERPTRYIEFVGEVAVVQWNARGEIETFVIEREIDGRTEVMRIELAPRLPADATALVVPDPPAVQENAD